MKVLDDREIKEEFYFHTEETKLKRKEETQGAGRCALDSMVPCRGGTAGMPEGRSAESMVLWRGGTGGDGGWREAESPVPERENEGELSMVGWRGGGAGA